MFLRQRRQKRQEPVLDLADIVLEACHFAGPASPERRLFATQFVTLEPAGAREFPVLAVADEMDAVRGQGRLGEFVPNDIRALGEKIDQQAGLAARFQESAQRKTGIVEMRRQHDQRTAAEMLDQGAVGGASRANPAADGLDQARELDRRFDDATPVGGAKNRIPRVLQREGLCAHRAQGPRDSPPRDHATHPQSGSGTIVTSQSVAWTRLIFV